jgi:hypothetical protein
MFFHNLTPKAPAGSKEHQPPHKRSNLESTKLLSQSYNATSIYLTEPD